MKKNICILISLFCLISCSQNVSKVNSDEQIFKWDFSKPKTIVYSFRQISSSEFRLSANSELSKNKAIISGQLIIDIGENRLADIILKELVATNYILDKNGKIIDSVKNSYPTKVVYGLSENGEIADKSNKDQFFDFLFPLPTKNIEKDSFELKEMSLPINANGKIIFVKGQNKITLVDIDKVNKEVKTFKCDFDISKMDLPKEFDGECICYFIGNSQ